MPRPPVRIVRAVPIPKCGSASATGVMKCALPPDHYAAGWEFHFGKDKLGRWRRWERRPQWECIGE